MKEVKILFFGRIFINSVIEDSNSNVMKGSFYKQNVLKLNRYKKCAKIEKLFQKIKGKLIH